MKIKYWRFICHGFMIKCRTTNKGNILYAFRGEPLLISKTPVSRSTLKQLIEAKYDNQ